MVFDDTPEVEVTRWRDAVQDNILGAFGITVLAFLLGAVGAVNTVTQTGLLLFLGFSIYIDIAQRLAQSLDLGRFPRVKGLAALFFLPLMVLMVQQIAFGTQSASIESVGFILQSYMASFAIFLVAAALFYGLTRQDAYREFKFHWQLVIVAGVVSVLPTFLVLAVQMVLQDVVPAAAGTVSNMTG